MDIMDDNLKRHLGRFAWEKHIEPEDLELLALYRHEASEANPGAEAYFAREFARALASAEFQEDLEAAGDDPVQRAYVYLEAELGAYPYRIDLD